MNIMGPWGLGAHGLSSNFIYTVLLQPTSYKIWPCGALFRDADGIVSGRLHTSFLVMAHAPPPECQM